MSSGKRLAIDGGEPVRPQLLPYGRQLVEPDDIAAVVSVLRSDWLTTGPAVTQFEEAFAASVGLPMLWPSRMVRPLSMQHLRRSALAKGTK